MELDLSDFDTAKKRKPGCSIAGLELTAEQRAKLDAVLDRPGEYSVAGVIAVLHAWGVQIGSDSLRTHRDKRCSCARSQ